MGAPRRFRAGRREPIRSRVSAGSSKIDRRVVKEARAGGGVVSRTHWRPTPSSWAGWHLSPSDRPSWSSQFKGTRQIGEEVAEEDVARFFHLPNATLRPFWPYLLTVIKEQEV